ncbi:type II restriction endonuclease [Ammoniphilus sp. CFH 90114]|uniref:type II restriction endonuclease n=1 Tax=Ammoniphilus sp. CFH 90114 TaxID=2493665 RepID=UPI00100EE3E0|nr:type II restriction endonuclease [Ammoniphilus sp. CFH 90114]RXT00983.1 restriction endonuclease [Ammoniphilus sp. CFH 90114]
MRRGYLSQYFEGVAIKRLRTVEVNADVSNQHELNGVRMLRSLLGDQRLTDYPANFLWLGGENEAISDQSSVTWYDSREKQTHRSSEYRLYFKKNDVMDLAQENDLMIIARRSNGQLYMIVAPYGSTLESQLLWLFGGAEDEVGFSFNFQAIEHQNDVEIDFAVRYILEELGIEIEEPEADYLDQCLAPYLQTGFPSTAVFSQLARRTVEVSAIEDPDNALLSWMEHEERLFKRLERHLVAHRIEQGFSEDGQTDVDNFIQFSLSVHNRRKSRVGYALENHLEELFKLHHVDYSRNKETENKSKPDFIFPNIQSYHTPTFPASRLTMLGVKSTCKDRWRQVLSEAQRIDIKHLFTLEPGISENQTTEMQANNLQLVLPQRLHQTYKTNQQSWLMDLNSFIGLVNERQTIVEVW